MIIDILLDDDSAVVLRWPAAVCQATHDRDHMGNDWVTRSVRRARLSGCARQAGILERCIQQLMHLRRVLRGQRLRRQ